MTLIDLAYVFSKHFIKVCNVLKLKHEIISYEWYSKLPKMVRVLNVAEKNDAAKSIAQIMSRGHLRKREGKSKFNKIYEFEYFIFNEKCQMIMTSVSGHLLNHEFVGSYKNWQAINPLALFDAPIVMGCLPDYEPIKSTIELEVRNCQYLIIWTDCDREGENIGFEVIDVCKKVKPGIKVYRAKFSEITPQAITRACSNLCMPDKKMSDAVNVRRELDLRIGAAFTRFQTLRLQKVFPDVLADKLISYGSCQFPTLGFVVERYKQVLAFIPESFWKLKVTHKKDDLLTEFSWKRGRLFDHTACLVLYQVCLEDPTAKVIEIKSRNKSKWRPEPLDTVEFEKLASRKLRIGAKEAMTIAEKLYTKGFISYPRTETNIFPKELDLVPLVEMQCEDHNWGEFARRVLVDGPNPRNGKKTDNAHPPIHPIKYIDTLQGNDQKVYELIVRHFLACVSKDAEGKETTIEIDVNNERFAASGLMIIAKNYLDVYPYDKWNAKVIGQYDSDETFQPTSIEMNEGETSAPDLLTEADLIGLMEKHGIGTDATHAEHIERIKSRLYVYLNESSRFLPGELGMGLVEGYDLMGFHMSKPYLRAELEADLKRITEGTKNPDVVLREQVAKYKECFIEVVRQALKLDNVLSTYLNSSPSAYQESYSSPVTPVMKCVKCQSGDIVLRTKKDNAGYFLTCMSYPNCNAAMWLPGNILEVTVSDEECNKCRGVKKLTFKLKPGSLMPFYPDVFTACLGGCDVDLMNMLGVHPITTGTGTSLSNNSSRSFDSGYDSHDHSSNQRNSEPSRQTNRVNSVQNISRSNTSSNVSSRSNFSSTANFQTNSSTNFSSSRNQRSNTSSNASSRSNFSSTANFQNNSSANFSSSRNQIRNINQRNSLEEPDIVCSCGQKAVVLTVRKEGPNTGRQFYKCPDNPSACNFFLWKDEAPSESVTSHHFSPDNSRNNFGNNNNRPSTSYITNNPTTEGSEGIPLCRCSLPAVIKTVSKEGANRGRHFFSCSKPREESCNFFQWATDDINASSFLQSQASGSGFQSTSRRRSGSPWDKPASKRKCGICSQPGHTRQKCPQVR